MHTFKRRTIEVLPCRMRNGAVTGPKVHCWHSVCSKASDIGPAQLCENLRTASLNKRCKQRMIQSWCCCVGNIEHLDNIAFFEERREEFTNMSFRVEC